MGAVDVLAQSDRYLKYAVDAEEHAEKASDDTDRAVWHLMAQSWLSLLPLLDGPGTQPRTSEEIPLAERLEPTAPIESHSPSP
jgi:hypothetical protein